MHHVTQGICMGMFLIKFIKSYFVRFPEASNSQFQVLEFSSVYKCSSQFRYQWLVSFYVFILRYILAASVSFQTHLWQCYSSIARQMVLVSTILWTEPGFEIHFFCVGRMECINLTYNNWLKRGKQHTFQRLCPPQNIRHLGHHPNSAAGTGALQLTLTLWPPERVHRACSTHDPFAQITFSSARHNSGVLFTLLTGWSFAQQRLPLVGRKTLAMQQLQEPKSEIFVNPTLKAAGKSFCSSKVCILSHQCQRLINLYFFSLGSVRDFYRAVFISLWERRPCPVSSLWSSLCSRWRSSTGPSVPELLLTLAGAWPTGDLRDIHMVFSVPGISSAYKSKEKEYWCLKG